MSLKINEECINNLTSFLDQINGVKEISSEEDLKLLSAKHLDFKKFVPASTNNQSSSAPSVEVELFMTILSSADTKMQALSQQFHEKVTQVQKKEFFKLAEQEFSNIMKLDESKRALPLQTLQKDFGSPDDYLKSEALTNLMTQVKKELAVQQNKFLYTNVNSNTPKTDNELLSNSLKAASPIDVFPFLSEEGKKKIRVATLQKLQSFKGEPNQDQLAIGETLFKNIELKHKSDALAIIQGVLSDLTFQALLDKKSTEHVPDVSKVVSSYSKMLECKDFDAIYKIECTLKDAELDLFYYTLGLLSSDKGDSFNVIQRKGMRSLMSQTVTVLQCHVAITESLRILKS